MKPDEDFPEVGALLAGFTVSFRFNNESRAAVWDCCSVVGVVAYEIFSYSACQNIMHRPTCFNAALDIASRIVSVCANYRTVLVSNYGGRVEEASNSLDTEGAPTACPWLVIGLTCFSSSSIIGSTDIDMHIGHCKDIYKPYQTRT